MMDICLRLSPALGSSICWMDFGAYLTILTTLHLSLPLVEAPHPNAPFAAKAWAESRPRTRPGENQPLGGDVRIVELSQTGRELELDIKWLWEKHMFPNPVKHPNKCGRDHPSYICDPDGLLAKSEAVVLDGCLQSLCQATECACEKGCSEACPGVRLSILLVRRLTFLHSFNRSAQSERQTALSQWSNHLRSRVWQLGTCDDDILLVVSAEDDFQMYMSIGSQVSHDISENCVEQVYHWIKPNLDQENFADALFMLIQDFRDILSGKHGCQTFPHYMATGTKIGIIYGITSIPIMLCVMAVFLAPCFRGRGRGGAKSRMSYTGNSRRTDTTPSTTYRDTVIVAGTSSGEQPVKL